jgi:hypothetical protein
VAAVVGGGGGDDNAAVSPSDPVSRRTVRFDILPWYFVCDQ